MEGRSLVIKQILLEIYLRNFHRVLAAVCLALSSVLFIIVFCNVGPEKKSHSTCEEETLSRG